MSELIRGSFGERHSRLALSMALVTAVVGVAMWLASTGTAAAHGERWFGVTLEQGDAQGYRWTVGAKGPVGEPLKKICAQVGVVSPPQPDVPYAEGNDLSVCGNLVKPADSVVSTTQLGSGESSSILFVAMYRPAVRKVSVVLGTGERKTYRPGVAKATGQTAKGMPLFRYLVVTVDGGACISRVTTSDSKDRVIDDEKKFACPAGV